MHVQVYLAAWFHTKVAVKRLVVREGSELRRLEAEKDFLNEIEVMSSCSHPNIVRFYSACIEPEEVRAPVALHGPRGHLKPREVNGCSDAQ